MGTSLLTEEAQGVLVIGKVLLSTSIQYVTEDYDITILRKT